VLELVDSHCHIDFESLSTALPAVLHRARANGITYMLCVCVTLEKFPQVRALAHDYPYIFASVGVHPNERNGRDPAADELVQLAQDRKVVAIGETGLDYYRTERAASWQHDRFRNHIRAAKAAGKPLIIHSRDAAADTLSIMAEEEAGAAGGVMHCFTESWETARAALDMNFYISFSGIVTFRNAASVRNVARQVPADRILIETDAPYLAPVPYRGKTNEPSYVRHVAECLATLRREPIEVIASQTTRNFFRLFAAAAPI
jgi:TatD DNase family protein